MKFSPFILKSGFLVVAFALTCGSVALATPLYQHVFDGSHTNLNGLPVDSGALAPANWSANATFFDDGVVDGTVEGSAMLPFFPKANRVYELSLDVRNTTDRWVALGFGRDALLAPGADNANDRLPNEVEGIAWLAFRDHNTDPTQDLQIFAGLGAANPIADNNTAVTFNQVNNLKIVIDTAVTGATFTANFFLNGVSITSTGLPVTVNRNIDDINFVAMSFDDVTTNTQISVDNFLLVPEPTSLFLGGLSLLGMCVSRHRG